MEGSYSQDGGHPGPYPDYAHHEMDGTFLPLII